MNYKEEYKNLVQKIKKYRADRLLSARNEDIATTLGYNRSYFSSLLGSTGVVTEDHINALKQYFSYVFENQTSPKADNQPIKDDYKDKYMALLESNDLFFKSSFGELLGHLQRIQAITKVSVEHIGIVEAKVLGKKASDTLDKIDKQINEELVTVAGIGIASSNQGKG